MSDSGQNFPLPDFWQGVRGEIQRRRGSAIPRRQSDERIPLSFQQERLWFAERIAPGRSVQNLAAPMRWSGPLNIPALQRALTEILSRHEILRTSIEVNGTGTWQKIDPPQPMHLQVTDLRGLPAEVQEQQVQARAAILAETPMDLQGGPLWCVELLQIRLEENILLRVFHHFIFDYWSGEVFQWDLALLYNAFANGEDVVLPPLPVQYADYTLWQRMRNHDVGKAFWHELFQGKIEPLLLPTQQHSFPRGQPRGAVAMAMLPETLLAELGLFSKAHGVSLFVVLLTGFKLLLHRQSGQRDLIVCTPVAGRSRLELRRLIGYFNNIIPVRTRINGDPTLAQLLQLVSQSMLAAQPHQEVPFQTIAQFPAEEGVSLKRALFSLLNTPGWLPKMKGLTVQPIDLNRETSDFDLSVFICPAETEWAVKARYRTDLLTPVAMQRLLDDYLAMLAQMTAAPQTKLSMLVAGRFSDGGSRWTRMRTFIRSVWRREFGRNEKGE